MSEPLWTSAEIGAAADGVATGGAFAVSGVSIDSRAVERGDLFVALSGVRDGHEFVAGALSAGAAGALTARPVDGPHVQVGDTLQALEALGRAARRRATDVKVGAVTGSVGKTSVTQAIAAGLALAGPAHASVKSYNNHIGVPLTLARMPGDTARAVFEIGMNHAGEITPLTRMVRPHAVAITNVGPVHVENFPDGEIGVARAKAEILSGLELGGFALLNADDRWFDLLAAEARTLGAEILRFGSDDTCEARLVSIRPDPSGGQRLRGEMFGRPLDITLRQAGAHWGHNALCTLLMLDRLGVDPQVAEAAMSDFAPMAGRGAERSVPLAGGAFVLIDDSYNANPVSMAAALATLGARPTTGRRIAVLTDMLELGEDSPRFHAALAEGIESAKVDLVFTAGPLMQHLWEALPAARRGDHAATAEALTARVVSAIAPGDLVMVKGSNGSKAGALAAALAAMGSGEGPA